MENKIEFEDILDAVEVVEQDILFEDVISNTQNINDKSDPGNGLHGSYVCKLIYFSDRKQYFVSHPLDNKKTIVLYSTTVEIDEGHSGSDVLVVFDGGDEYKPIVTGIVKQLIKTKDLNLQSISVKKGNEETLFFEADKEIVFKCGKSSITLTKSGKVLIRGAYLLSRSSGVNRIKGGSVHLN